MGKYSLIVQISAIGNRNLISAPRARRTIFERASSTVVGILLAPLARRDRLGEAVWTVTVASVGLVEGLHPRYGLLSNANIGVLT